MPNDNTATIWISFDALNKIIKQNGKYDSLRNYLNFPIIDIIYGLWLIHIFIHNVKETVWYEPPIIVISQILL